MVPADPLEIRIRDLKGHRVVYLQGELSMTTAPAIESFLRATLAERELRLVLDLGNVNFIDSSGFGALVSWRRRVLDGGGTFLLMRVPESLKNILKFAQMEGRFEMIESENALSSPTS